ncbi:response regulator [Fluviicola taffensis]|uniref:Two component transcriptional regulator, winged helix family n=1 Tax=Fluviicola taffensis (strain DSM 16823 / NCIMB 13979 / RW262) TaxID=755732 RepID=F2IFU8_FLUTR|nr:response regulator [Fluviicola taffensis]AEA42556.1 two component transcriptional regulator, winged helix family [Fluviicola taffensis DSM 16823]
MSKAEILIIDDEPHIRKLLEINLESNDYKVSMAETGQEGLLKAVNHPPDLIILDLGLPDKNGHIVLKELREWYGKPIIILSAQNEEESIVKALDNGANDYLTKPFRSQELLARIRSGIRHSESQTVITTMEFGDIELDLTARVVKKRGQEVKLTFTEYSLLVLLAKYAGKVLTHQFILKEVWGPGYQMETQYLRVFVAQIRKKIEENPNDPKHLLTESRVGYRFI